MLSLVSTLLFAGPAGATAPAAAATPVTLTLPAPTGHHQVGTTELHLVDPSRRDPWKPDHQRELMVSAWYPARDADRYPLAPWLPAGVAPYLAGRFAQPDIGVPAGGVDWVGARSHGHVGAPVARRAGGLPVLLYSPGMGSPRELETGVAEELASRGYLVITVDHTFEAAAVEFPGGRVEPAVPFQRTPEFFKTAFDARLADVHFVLDQLDALGAGDNPDAEHRQLPKGLRGSLDLSDIGMFGHSCGGFTTGESMYNDQRIRAGVTLDGVMAYALGANYQPGEVVKHGLDRPFMLMGSQQSPDGRNDVVDHTVRNPADQSWVDFWANQRGWKLNVLLQGSRHYSYTDMETVVSQLAGPFQLPADRVEHIIGTIPAAQATGAETAYLRAFFDRFLRHRAGHLLDGPSSRYPQVTFVA
ncbi:lipase [Solihabitans fulvus]|uniref:Lipase n=1 Tax=Solihabitans fulvus TaxID=1892852 RepID=A0A5B2X2Y7_9PSEU|nr:lipase [Solihabitans fulvus]